jgi:hypothetical protein
LLHKYCKEGAFIVTYFWVPKQKREKKNCWKKTKNNSSEKRMSKHPENGKTLVEEVQKYKD